MSAITRHRVGLGADFVRVDVDGTPVGFVQVNRDGAFGPIRSFLLLDLNEVGIRLAEACTISGAAAELTALMAPHVECTCTCNACGDGIIECACEDLEAEHECTCGGAA